MHLKLCTRFRVIIMISPPYCNNCKTYFRSKTIDLNEKVTKNWSMARSVLMAIAPWITIVIDCPFLIRTTKLVLGNFVHGKGKFCVLLRTCQDKFISASQSILWLRLTFLQAWSELLLFFRKVLYLGIFLLSNVPLYLWRDSYVAALFLELGYYTVYRGRVTKSEVKLFHFST